MQNDVTTEAASRTTVALALSAAAVVIFLVAIVVAQERNDWLWPVAAIVGGVGAVMGWAAGKPRPQGRALAAVVLGGLVFVAVLGWVIWAAATGNF